MFVRTAERFLLPSSKEYLTAPRSVQFTSTLGTYQLTPAQLASYFSQRGIRSFSEQELTPEKIHEQAGIERLYWMFSDPLKASPEYALYILCAFSSLTLHKHLHQWEVDKPDIAIVTTTYRPGFNLADQLVSELYGTTHGIRTLNVHYACAGFAKALAIVHNEIQTGRLSLDAEVLIISPEIYSPHIGPSPYMDIFSDGVVVTSFRHQRDLTIHASAEFSYPERMNQMMCMARPYAQDSENNDSTIALLPPLSDTGEKTTMDRSGMTKFILREPVRALHAVRNMLDPAVQSHIQFALVHGANGHMPQLLSEKAGLPCISNIAEVGNLSSASIPYTWMHLSPSVQPFPGDIILINGFGAGLTNIAVAVEVRSPRN